MIREISSAAIRVGVTAIRIPINAALGIARTALGNGQDEPEGANRASERKRSTPAKRATPPRRRPAAKPKAKASTTESKAKPKTKPRGTTSGAQNGSSKASEKTETPSEAQQRTQPRQAKPGEAVSGFPEPPGEDPGDISKDPTPHHALSNPVENPDPTEWPDPYEGRDDPRDPPDPDAHPFGAEPHPKVGSTSTSEPHPSADLEAGDRAEPPQRDKLDD